MYCKNCGNPLDQNAVFCGNCGWKEKEIREDKPNFGFALLGFFFPLVGLILYLVYENETPKRAKSAGKGALSGFITSIVIGIIIAILYFVFAFSFLNKITSSIMGDGITSLEERFRDKTTEEILREDVDITFGEFSVTNNGHFTDTSLPLTVKNKDDDLCSYHITIEAVDENGARIETDTVYVDRLGRGQEIHVTAFGYVEEEKVEEMQNATFRVLEIKKFERD